MRLGLTPPAWMERWDFVGVCCKVLQTFRQSVNSKPNYLDPINVIWSGLFLVAFLIGLGKLFGGEHEIFGQILDQTFKSAKLGFEIALGLTAVLTLWMGIMKIGEEAGFVRIFTRFLTPLFRRITPEVPKDHPALGAMVMNMAANMLGLDNAATPLGLKAMHELQTLNPEKETATNAQVLFLVINTSSVTILPVTIFAYRAQMGAANPTDVFIPILIATYVSTLVGFLSVSLVQRINLLDPVILAYFGCFTLAIGMILTYFSGLAPGEVNHQSSLVSSVLLFSIMVLFIVRGCMKRINVYSAFIEGAKDGFSVAVKIIPYLVAMLVAIGVFRAAGGMDWIVGSIRWVLENLGIHAGFVEALPTALTKPLSGSGARGMLIETMQTYGADSFVGRVASVVQGSTETTFYVVAVYFGAVGVRRTRHTVPCGLLADFAGIIAAILISYLFFRP